MKKSADRHIRFIVIATGIASVVTQIVVIREFLTQFNGNEFVIALILFNWLLLGGMGTFMARAAGKKASLLRLAWISVGLIILAPLELLMIRYFRDVFFIYGSSAGFYPTFAYAFLTIIPYGLLLGFALPYSLVTARNLLPAFSGTRVYIADNIGDTLGGILFSFALVAWVTPFQALCIAHLPLLYLACRVFAHASRPKTTMAIAGAVCLFALAAGMALEKGSLTPPGMTLSYYQESRYGRIAVYSDRKQHTLYLDGKPVMAGADTALAEESVHYPLSQLPSVNGVLLISAQGGMMAEVAKHRPAFVDYVEIDPVLSDAAFAFGFLENLSGLTRIHEDGRAWLYLTETTYDAVILSLPEPDTFQINRFFTDAFFNIAKTRLGDGGILSFSVTGFDNYIRDEQAVKIASLRNTAKKHFKHVALLPGEKIHFLCADFAPDTDIVALLDVKNIQTDYIHGLFHGNVTADRTAYLYEHVNIDAPLNRDFSPHLMRLMYKDWFARFSTSPTGFLVTLALFFSIYLARSSREEFVLFSTGCVLMGSQILIIFAFQILFGYIYEQIGWIVTVFLAGLLPGAMFGHRIRAHGAKILIIADGALMALLLVFLFLITYAGDRLPPAAFLILGLSMSAACGIQMPVALYLRGDKKSGVIQAFSADLIGAAAGTLITSVILIPYIGIIWTTLCLAGLKLISAGLMYARPS